MGRPPALSPPLAGTPSRDWERPTTVCWCRLRSTPAPTPPRPSGCSKLRGGCFILEVRAPFFFSKVFSRASLGLLWGLFRASMGVPLGLKWKGSPNLFIHFFFFFLSFLFSHSMD